ncbi:hypothetical protein PCC79_01795 [Propioniciclava soli]|uniref:DUF4352 domain-containing protein n=1 Tax=Propioniciclava soli TaxID=2775081 RepID=A0ABZ3C8T4_9ACTN
MDLKAASRRPSGVVVAISSIEAVDGNAILPGEVAAPAVRVTIVLRNEGSTPVSLGSVVVNGYSGTERTPMESLVSPGGQPFAGSLQPGAEAMGVYLFSIPVAQRGDVTITVDPKAGEPASVLRGDATR